MPDFSSRDKSQIYDNMTEIKLNQQKIDILQREFSVFRSELSTQLAANQDHTILRIEKMLSDKYRSDQRWKNGTIIGLIGTLIAALITQL